jgi:hypothetical protein
VRYPAIKQTLACLRREKRRKRRMREVVRNRTTDIDPASSDYVHALEVRNPSAT